MWSIYIESQGLAKLPCTALVGEMCIWKYITYNIFILFDKYIWKLWPWYSVIEIHMSWCRIFYLVSSFVPLPPPPLPPLPPTYPPSPQERRRNNKIIKYHLYWTIPVIFICRLHCKKKQIQIHTKDVAHINTHIHMSNTDKNRIHWPSLFTSVCVNIRIK